MAFLATLLPVIYQQSPAFSIPFPGYFVFFIHQFIIMKRIISLLFLWLCWGFALGTVTLLVLLRVVLNYTRRHNWPESRENMVVYFFMALLALVSFVIAYSSQQRVDDSLRTGGRAKFYVVPAVLAIAALFIMMNPSLVNIDKSKSHELSAGFTIGPYPDKDKMEKLKDAGFTTLVSLLHPAVVPFEPKLMNEEAENAEEVGLKLVSIPLLPWISDNQNAIDSLRRLVKLAKGKYYIHCYLGKDRVNVARRIIMQEAGNEGIALETQIAHRKLDDIATFERGAIHKLDSNTWLTPMPTREEYFGYIIAGNFNRIVSILDFSEPGYKEIITAEQEWLRPYNIALEVHNMPGDASEQRVKQLLDSVRRMPRPLLIHTFRTDLPIAQTILKLYK